jgi:hypothetical protein
MRRHTIPMGRVLVFVAGRSVSTAEFERTGFRGAASDPRSSGAYGAPCASGHH